MEETFNSPISEKISTAQKQLERVTDERDALQKEPELQKEETERLLEEMEELERSNQEILAELREMRGERDELVEEKKEREKKLDSMEEDSSLIISTLLVSNADLVERMEMKSAAAAELERSNQEILAELREMRRERDELVEEKEEREKRLDSMEDGSSLIISSILVSNADLVERMEMKSIAAAAAAAAEEEKKAKGLRGFNVVKNALKKMVRSVGSRKRTRRG